MPGEPILQGTALTHSFTYPVEFIAPLSFFIPGVVVFFLFLASSRELASVDDAPEG